jgi:hypothetical protein
MNRFSHLTEDEVTSLQREAAEAQKVRDDIDRRAQDALDVICGRSDAMSVEEALAQFKEATEEEREAPIPAYIAPVKRWAGGPPEIDAWYWDRP